MARALKYDASGNAINKYGVKITANQQRLIKNLSQTVNRRRQQLLKEEEKRIKGLGEEKGVEYPFVESFFIMQKKSRSLQRFQSKKEVQSYIAKLRKQAKPGYIDKATKQYNKNYLKAMNDVFGDAISEEAYEKLRKMTPEQFRTAIATGMLPPIDWIYITKDLNGKASQMEDFIMAI